MEKKIFAFDFGGVTDWVLAKDPDQAKEFYETFTQCGEVADDEIREVPESEWNTSYILDTEDFEPDGDDHDEDDYCNGYKIEMTFAEFAEQNSCPEFMATTNY